VTKRSNEIDTVSPSSEMTGTSGDRGTITGLFTMLSQQFGLRLDVGVFPANQSSPAMARLGLYSTEPEPIHRYAFATWWAGEALNATVTWVMLNPATGDTDGKPRPILTGCRHRSERWGYSGLIVVNLFAFRTRDPRRLLNEDSKLAIGEHNDAIVHQVSGRTAETIAAWGDHGTFLARDKAAKQLLRAPKCLPKAHGTVSAKGQPFYPKGVRLDARRIPLPLEQR
jgi:hypothetical protein